MVEFAMFAALGALAAALLFLAGLPVISRRAERLALKRIALSLPVSFEAIRAERDQLRAELAVKERRAEQQVEAARSARLADQTETGRKLVDLHARDQTITVLESVIADRKAEVLRLADDLAARDGRIVELSAELAAAQAQTAAQAASIGSLESSLRTQSERAEALRLEIATLQATRDVQMLRLGDVEADLRKVQARLTEKSDEARRLDRSVRDLQSGLAQSEKARQRAEDLAGDRQSALRKSEELVTRTAAERDDKARLLEAEIRIREGLEDEIDRRALRIQQVEAELAALRQHGAQTTSELTRRTGEVAAERQARKAAEQALRDAERKLSSFEKRLTATIEAREGSESARIAALENQLRLAMTREADLQKQLDRLRRTGEVKGETGLVETTDMPLAPPAPSNDPSAAPDPRLAIAAMRERLRRRLDEPAPDHTALQREAPMRTALPGE